MSARSNKKAPSEPNEHGLALDPIGFGFVPHESEAHFTVTLGGSDVVITEHARWSGTTDDDLVTFGPSPDHVARVRLDRVRWDRVVEGVEHELNARLRQRGMASARFKSGRVPVGRLYGKEIVLLAWAIEDADPALCAHALTNWLGLTPEERWWLYTMTAAATGHATLHRGVGWRKGLRFALTENPVAAFRSAAAVPTRPSDVPAQIPIVAAGNDGQLGLLGLAPPSTAAKRKPPRPRKGG